MAHQADPPDLTGQGAEAGTEFQVVFIEKTAAYGGIIDALWD